MHITDEEQLIAYKDVIQEIAQKRQKHLLPNVGVAHGICMMTEMFRQTKSSMLMVTESFSSDPDYLKELDKALDRVSHAQFIILGDDQENSAEAIKIIQKYQSNKIILQQATDVTKYVMESKLKKEEFDKLPNFAVFDDSMFRLETLPTKFAAIGSFNNRKHSQKLTDIFRYMSASTQPL